MNFKHRRRHVDDFALKSNRRWLHDLGLAQQARKDHACDEDGEDDELGAIDQHVGGFADEGKKDSDDEFERHFESCEQCGDTDSDGESESLCADRNASIFEKRGAVLDIEQPASAAMALKRFVRCLVAEQPDEEASHHL